MSSFRDIINRWLEGNSPEEADKVVRNDEDAARYLATQLAMEEALEDVADEERVHRWREAHRHRRRRKWWLGGAGLLLLLAAAWLWNRNSLTPDGQEASGPLAEDTIVADKDKAVAEDRVVEPDTTKATGPPARRQSVPPPRPESRKQELPEGQNWLYREDPNAMDKAAERYSPYLIVAGGDWENAFAKGEYGKAADILEGLLQDNPPASIPEQAFILGLIKLLYPPEKDYPASAALLDAAYRGASRFPNLYDWVAADIDIWRYLAYTRMDGNEAEERAQALARPAILDSLRVFLAE